MEKVYLKFVSDSVSSNIHFKPYFQEFHDEVHKACGIGMGETSLFSNLVKFTEEQEDILSQACSVEKLDLPKPFEPLDPEALLSRAELYEKLPVPKNCNLKSVKSVTSRNEVEQEQILNMCKYRGQKFVLSDEHKSTANDLVPTEDVIFTVLIYVPFNYQYKSTGKFHKIAHRGIKSSQEIMVLGSQTLDVLRDAVLCVEDFNDTQGDISQNPFKDDRILQSSEKYKSSMFYFGNDFYIDTRYVNCKDYSQCIKDFSEKHQNGFGETKIMQDCKFIDLIVKLGYPYVYQHQGNCEHLIVFKSARLVHKTDVLVSSVYPLHVTLTPMKARFCNICGRWIAKWCVRNCAKLPNDPSYLCKLCFKSYLYVDGKKIVDFQAYKFCDTKALL